MLSPSDFNNAVPQFTNGDYASNPINPQYIAEPDAVDYNRGAEPLQTLPAQWWNWFLNKFTARFNKVNIYVKNIFNELTQLLSLVNITPDGTESTPTTGQLKTAFKTEYPKYLALLMYPVGSIYWTGKAPDDGGDPNILFGGTWVQIKGKFVWAKGDGDTLNATGGEKTVTLTTSQIPSHNHSFTPSGTIGNTTATGSISDTTATGTIGNTTATGSIGYTTAGGSITGGAYEFSGLERHLRFITGSSWRSTASYNVSEASWTTTNGGGIETNSSYQNTVRDWGWTDSGTISVTTNPDFHGTQHYHSFTGNAHTHSFAGAAHKHTFTGIAHNHSFTGTAGTTGNKGDGDSHNNMPPYVVKYCWERTA